MTRKQKRLSVIAGALAFLGAATALTFYALGQRTSYFYMPSDLAAATVEPGQRIRLGGLVEKGSVSRGQDTSVAFAITDTTNSVKVVYDGPIPAPIAAGAPIAKLVVTAPDTKTIEVPLVAGAPVEQLGLFGRLGAALRSVIWGPQG